MIIKGSEIKKEHEQIERELIELETVINTSLINYPNLLRVIRNLKTIWEAHEEKETVFFRELHEKGFSIPIKKINFEHGKLGKDLSIIMSALEEGKEDQMHAILDKYGKHLINNLRQHMADEDWILYALPKKYLE